MVKLQGPAMSQGAAGKLGGSLVFANSPRGPYAKKLTAPKQPRSIAQISIRAMVKFLSQNWALISSADQTTWDAIAQKTSIASYHAYLGHNAKRWRNQRSPTEIYPAAELAAISTDYTLTAFAGVRRARIRMRNTGTPTNIWIHLLFHSLTAGATTDWQNLIHVQLLETSSVNVIFNHTPIIAARHYYTTVVAVQDGRSNFAFTQTSNTLVTDE